jgi:hypothetical protein
MRTKCWSENPKGGDHSVDLDVDGKTFRIDIRDLRWEGVDWIYLAQDRDQWLALVYTVMSLLVP